MTVSSSNGLWQLIIANQVYTEKTDVLPHTLHLEVLSVSAKDDASKFSGPSVKAHFGVRWWGPLTTKGDAKFKIESGEVGIKFPETIVAVVETNIT